MPTSKAEADRSSGWGRVGGIVGRTRRISREELQGCFTIITSADALKESRWLWTVAEGVTFIAQINR